jgi:hypothetical protein
VLGSGVKWVSKVGGARAGDPEGRLVIHKQVVNELLILSVVVFLDDAELSLLSS